MKKIMFIASLIGVSYFSTLSYADNETDQAGIASSVPNISLIDVNDVPINITFDTITEAGQGFNAETENSTFAITTNVTPGSTKAIQAKMEPVLTGLTLRLTMSNFTSGTPLFGRQTLTDSFQNIIGGIDNRVFSDGEIEYLLSPDVASGTIPPESTTALTISYIIVDE